VNLDHFPQNGLQNCTKFAGLSKKKLIQNSPEEFNHQQRG
jgi:hypothetical protein